MAMQLGPRRPLTEINVTPLVDVVLVLLIIFMVLTPLVEKQKYLRVPEKDLEAQPAESAPRDEVVLTALENGKVRLDLEELPLEEATGRLRAAYEGRPSKVLFFNAEDGVKYELAFRALDAAHAAGVNTIGLMTDPPGAHSATDR